MNLSPRRTAVQLAAGTSIFLLGSNPTLNAVAMICTFDLIEHHEDGEARI
ncbi:hypothetical protein [Mucilaginibacter pineti]|nr:hypothetical protein [Mucilaginibacter pineti]